MRYQSGDQAWVSQMHDFEERKKKILNSKSQAIKFHRKEMLKKQLIAHQRQQSLQENKDKEALVNFTKFEEQS